MASTARIDELKKKFDENPRRYFAPLANEFRKAGDIDQAILICEEFLPQQPGHMSGHIVYGQALYEAGKMPESRTVFETALGLDPENLIALRHLGDIARNQSEHVAARNWYLRVLDADPRNEEIQALIATLDSESPPEAPGPELVEAPGFEMGLDFEKEVAPFEMEILPTEQDAPAAELAPAAEDAPVDPSLLDTAPLGVPVIPPRLYSPPPARDGLVDGFSPHGFATQPESGAEAHDYLTPAEGLESTAFSPPDEHIPESGDLDASLESGVPSFSAPVEPIESIAGLQGSGGSPHAELDDSEDRSEQHGFAPMVLDDGLVLPPQGDPLAAELLPPASEPPPHETSSDLESIEFDVPHPEPARSEDVEPAELQIEELVASEPAAEEEEAPIELPPEVIAAEAELINAGETPAPPAPPALGIDPDTEPAGSPPFLTETMAELYLAQGFPAQALSVYAQLLAAHPHDARLSGLVASLTPSDAVGDSGPNVRDFFARLSARRPGARSAAAAPPADDDFAPPEQVVTDEGTPDETPYSVAEADANADVNADPDADADAGANPSDESYVEAPPEAVAPAIERAAAMRTPHGSIDALFSNRPSGGTTEDSAAAALAQAFGGEAAAPPPVMLGRAAHAASGELSLDSVFRDGPARPPRTSQSFSFDQFFTGPGERSSGPTPARTSGELAMPAEAPAERSADDIEQFNSWLQGLKKK